MGKQADSQMGSEAGREADGQRLVADKVVKRQGGMEAECEAEREAGWRQEGVDGQAVKLDLADRPCPVNASVSRAVYCG